jgi:glycosyltransferase involved in cell wall biosynthesis
MDCSRHPTVSVVVCTLGTSRRLRNCVLSMVAQHCANFEIFVVHSGMAQESIQAQLDGLHVQIVRVPRPGVCHARNSALPLTRGEILAFVDDDVTSNEDWVHAIAAPFADPAVGCVCGLTQAIGEPYLAVQRYESAGALSEWTLTNRDANWVGRVLSSDVGFGCNMAFLRSFLEECPFPEDLGAGSLIGSGDEYYMFLQALRHGAALCHTPAAVVRHYFDEDERTIERRVRSLISGTVALHLKLLLEIREVRFQLARELLGRMGRALGWGIKRHATPPRWRRMSAAQKCRTILQGIELYLQSLVREPSRSGRLEQVSTYCLPPIARFAPDGNQDEHGVKRSQAACDCE